MNKTNKDFDCVALKRRVQEEIYEETKGLSPEAELEYFRANAEKGPFGALYRALLARRRATHGDRQ